MSSDLRSPTRLPQPVSPISPSDTGSENAIKSKDSRRRSLLPQRSISGGVAKLASASGLESLKSDGELDTGSGAEDAGSANARQRLGSVAESAQGNEAMGEHDAVLRQRQAALDALMGESSVTSAQRPGHTRAASSLSRQSRTIPKPGLSKGTMPPPSGLSRTSSTRRSAAIGGSAPAAATTKPSSSKPERSSRMPPPSAAASAVSRNQSRHAASSSTGSARPSSRSSTTTTTSARPPSASSARPPSVTSSSATGRTSRSEAAASGTALKRSSSTREPTKHSSIRPTSIAVPSLQSKPQFTTYQQHYSPKKDFAPKPLTSSFFPKASSAIPTLSPSRGTPLEPPTADILRQQTDLLQLSLLHEQALPCLASFQTSAEHKLRARFAALAKRSATVQASERLARTRQNASALRDWGAGVGGLQEGVSVLSGVLREIAALQGGGGGGGNGDEAGRFDRLLAQFVEWVDGVERAWFARVASSSSAVATATTATTVATDFDIPEPLPQSWHLELAALQRKVALSLRELECLPVPTPGTSVAEVVDGVKASLRGMEEELRASKALVTAIMARDSAWLDEEVRKQVPLESGDQVAVNA